MAYAFSLASRYQDTEIQSADPLELVILLYEGALRHLRRAEIATESSQTATRAESIGRALAIIGELQATLDHQRGGEIARSLGRLYEYITRQLTRANLGGGKTELSEVAGILETLLSGWKEARAKVLAQEKTAPAIAPVTDRITFGRASSSSPLG
jgi:flagellar protein FliS